MDGQYDLYPIVVLETSNGICESKMWNFAVSLSNYVMYIEMLLSIDCSVVNVVHVWCLPLQEVWRVRVGIAPITNGIMIEYLIFVNG